jgi:hypothetical protein
MSLISSKKLLSSLTASTGIGATYDFAEYLQGYSKSFAEPIL